MKSINYQNRNNSDTYRGVSFDGFTLTVDMTAKATANGSTGTFSTAQMCFLENLQLQGTLHRDGQKIVVFNTNARNLAFYSLFLHSAFDLLDTKGKIIKSSANQRAVLPVRIMLGGTINLNKDDKFVVEWTLNDGFFHADVDPAASEISLDVSESIGLEYTTPRIVTQVIEGAQDNPEFHLGDNITKIVFGQYDKTDILIASAPISSVRLNSDKVRYNDSWTELVNKRDAMFQTIGDGDARYQSFLLYDAAMNGGVELDGVSLNMSLISANVNAGKNVLIYGTFDTSNDLVTKADVRSQRHTLQTLKKGAPKRLASVNKDLLNANV